MSELLAVDVKRSIDKEHLRRQLAQLETEINFLTTFEDASFGLQEQSIHLIPKLLEEAAWIYADALHLAILVLDEGGESEANDLREPRAVVDALLNDSAVNLEPRLLPGYDESDVSGSSSAAHATWRDAYERREQLLLASAIVTGQPLPNSLAEIAARSLKWVSIRRFEDLVTRVVVSWD
ncbi:hypothetical protein AAFP32_10120 [Brevibacterium sp. CBA3109]|uniref:DUF222 domain-containing protein n=1 Tax=Brevibacterium koreense TaxID=3140787 RepID=A0AAU7UHE9_9MICO